MAPRLFDDRRDAGRVLAKRLSDYADRADVTVLALPRGGVPVAYEVAQALRAPMDVFVVRKIGVPGHEEYAVGAMAPGVRQVNQKMVELLDIDPVLLRQVIEKEQAELDRRQRLYREGKPALELRGRCVIVVDDGLATGASMRAALQALRPLQPARIIVAIPVSAERTCIDLRQEADEVVCAETPFPFVSVGSWYRNFAQVSDDEVKQLLADATTHHSHQRATP